MSIFAGLTASVKIAGIIGLSSWLPLNQDFPSYVPENAPNKSTPIFMGHGDADPMIRCDLAQASEKLLKDMGYNVTLKMYR